MPRLSKELANRILDRAASLDAAEDKVDVATLRAAARDAGISPEAFERALSESAPLVRGTAPPSQLARVGAYDVAVRSIWVGALTGAAAILIVSGILGPDKDAFAGAVIGGGGALVGVFVHLLNRFRKRNQ